MMMMNSIVARSQLQHRQRVVPAENLNLVVRVPKLLLVVRESELSSLWMRTRKMTRKRKRLLRYLLLIVAP